MENNETKQESTQDASPAGSFKAKCCAGACKHKKYILGAIVLLAIVGYAVYQKNPDSFRKIFTKNLTADQAKAKAQDFIEKNLVQPGTKIEIKGVTEENGLYKIPVDVQGQEIISYMSKDGSKFFPQVMNIAEIEKQTAESKQAEVPKEIPKSDKPTVDLYVMSFCPYGNKAEDTMKPVYDLLKNKITFNVHYIVSTNGNDVQSLHGPTEVAQNEREACVLKNYGKDKWFNFAAYVNKNCGSDGSCWEAGAKSLGISSAKISACANSEGVALMKADEKDSNAAGATGSPTLNINGVSSNAVYQYGSSEAYKQAICAAFNTVPTECSKALSSVTTTASQGGSCGS